MTPPLWLAITMFVLAVIPLLVTLRNLLVYRRPAPVEKLKKGDKRRVFVCIPARDEELNIGPCALSLLKNKDPGLRVLIYDDESTDQTPEVVRALLGHDDRVRVVPTEPLPQGWNGKQHACWRMARAAIDGTLGEPPAKDKDLLLFTDADVRFHPACVRTAVAEADYLNAELLSTFPRQFTMSLGERLLVPMMFYLLFGYLPMGRMRLTGNPATSAGCGQFLLARVGAYEASGGHQACKGSMHEGIKLPRAFREAGLHTDLFDGTKLCGVRMYEGFGQTWRGFTKNAYEGLGSLGLLLVMTAVHLVAHVLPVLIVASWVVGVLRGEHPASAVVPALVLGAVWAPIVQRFILAVRLGHSVVGAFLHPVGVLLMTLIQWQSCLQHLKGTRSWKGRVLEREAV